MEKYKITVREYDDGSIKHYDENNNEIYYKNSDGFEIWFEYNENNNLIHYKNSNGYEFWYEFDENNNRIYFKNSNRVELFFINNNIVTKEEWEKHYNRTNKLILNGKEYPISSETLKSIKELLNIIS